MAAKVADSSKTMLAAYVTEWLDVGTVPDKVSFGNVPAPATPQKSQVLIDVKAASINVSDIALLQDTGAGGWCYHTRKPTVAAPLVGGQDYAGIVSHVGPDCKRLKVGDRVCGVIKVLEYQTGTWAEQTVALEHEVCLINDENMSYVEAAAASMGAFVNGDMMKRAKSKLSAAGCRCLVVGASGALGTLMLQMLRKYNAHVTAVCSSGNVEMVKKMGADVAVDYTSKPFSEQLVDKEKFEVVFDFVGGKNIESQAAKLLTRGGLFITAVGDREHNTDKKLTCCEFTSSFCKVCRHSCCGCCSPYKWIMSQGYPPLTEEIWKPVIEAGARAHLAEEVPFAEAPLRKAMTRVASHHSGGRVVINLETRS